MELNDVMTAAMKDWPEQFDQMTAGERHRIETEAAALAVHAARISAYLSSRSVFNGTHDDAVKAQNRTASKVRKAIGFTYAAEDRITF